MIAILLAIWQHWRWRSAHTAAYKCDCNNKQECIPVGCVPPAAVAVGGRGPGQFPLNSPLGVGLDQIPLNFPLGCGPGDPPEPGNPPQAHPPGPGTPQDQATPRPGIPRGQAPLPRTESQTPVKKLPCPKLRLRAVITSVNKSLFCIVHRITVSNNGHQCKNFLMHHVEGLFTRNVF